MSVLGESYEFYKISQSNELAKETGVGFNHITSSFRPEIFLDILRLVDFDQRYSAYPTPTYPSDSVSVAKNSKDVTGKTKSARNFIYTLIR